MSQPPPPLDYRPGPDPSAARRNVFWKVALRALAGLVAGIAACIAGVLLASLANLPMLFMVPPLAVLGTAVFVAIRFRRFGYVTGVVLAPMVIAVFVFVLLLMVCGSMLKV